eukprot:gene4867-7885_t
MYLEPASFVSGQEIRIQLKATLDGGGLKDGGIGKELFNTSATGTLKVRVYQWSSTSAGDCETYYTAACTGSCLYETAEFGLSSVERYEGN